MNRAWTILLGVLAVVPMVLLGALVVPLARLAWATHHALHAGLAPEARAAALTHALDSAVHTSLLLLAGVVVTSLVMLAAFLVDLYRNPRIPPTERRAWVLGFVLMGGVAMPVYWYQQCWRARGRA